jgi:hypothetical protein
VTKVRYFYTILRIKNIANIDSDFRAWVYAVTWMIWVGGMAFLPLIAWLCGNWFYIGLATSIPGFVLFFYYPYLPESPRWLISVGRKDDAAKIILNIAKTNGTEDELSPAELNYMLKRLIMLQEQDKSASGKNIGVWTLFSRPRLAKNTIMLTISWYVILHEIPAAFCKVIM